MTKKAEKAAELEPKVKPLTKAMKDPNVDEIASQPENTEPAALPVADLTGKVTGLWPGNPPNRSGNFYFDLNRLELEAGQMGLLGSLCENFVFERVDVHLISEAESDFCLEILADYPTEPVSLDTFVVPAQSKQVSRVMNGEALQAEKMLAGTFMGRKRAWLKFHNALPKQGRIVINFIGYLIEPWR